MRVLLAMSGGVDSSVAASLLQKQGYEVTGVFMQLDSAPGEGGCASAKHSEDVQKVADMLGIELHVLHMNEHFEELIEYFINEYRLGRTPNPCIVCNRNFKFGKIVELADSLGIEKIATGHYARSGMYNDRPAIMRGKNAKKDQSYVLNAVRSEIIGRIVLPIGEIDSKETVRQMAMDIGLDVHDKPDSQEICFVPNDDYIAFIEARAEDVMKPGKILDADGNVLGEHQGYARYTIGQRRGLGVAAGEPMYVINIDSKSGDVTIGTRSQAMGRTLEAKNVNWHIQPSDEQFRAAVQIRYNHRGTDALVRITGPDSIEVQFDQPIHAITPGQAAVVYDGDFMLGGGFIE